MTCIVCGRRLVGADLDGRWVWIHAEGRTADQLHHARPERDRSW